MARVVRKLAQCGATICRSLCLRPGAPTAPRATLDMSSATDWSSPTLHANRRFPARRGLSGTQPGPE
jgi:hypothetical protein